MPVTYTYDAENEFLNCQIGEELDILEIVEYLRSVYRDDEIGDDTIEFVHLDQVSEFSVRANDVRGAESDLGNHVTTGKFIATIFVGLSPLQIGIANMLSGLLTTMFPDYPAIVVRSREEALDEAESIRRGDWQAARTEETAP